MYGARRPRDTCAISARRPCNARMMRCENIAKTPRGHHAALAHTFCIVRTHFVVRMPFPHAWQMSTIKKKTLWIFTHMIYEEFFVGFFFLWISLNGEKVRFVLFPIQLGLSCFVTPNISSQISAYIEPNLISIK
jgi:hypothetical protein